MDNNSEFNLLDLSCLADAVKELRATGHAAWRQGLMAGFSGNLSVRAESSLVLITCAGVGKGHLTTIDFALMDMKGKVLTRGKDPSSESGLHLAIYQAYSECRAILHTHPPRMQALELTLSRQGRDAAGKFLKLDLHEADLWRNRLAFSTAGQPGAGETAREAVNVLASLLPGQLPCGVWLPSHGLCAVGETLAQALALTEELEHLAGIQLMSGQNI